MSICQEAAALREHWLAYLIEGILLVVLGAAAIVVPSWATLTVTIFSELAFSPQRSCRPDNGVLVETGAGLLVVAALGRTRGRGWRLVDRLAGQRRDVVDTCAAHLLRGGRHFFDHVWARAPALAVGPLGLAGAQWHHRPVLSRSNPLYASRYCGLGTGAAGRHRFGLWRVGADRSVADSP
jgi:hypothetical protein